MKIWMLAGLFTVATVPFAAAAETDLECQLEETRRAPQMRIDAEPTGGAGAPQETARPTSAPRQTAQRTQPREETTRAPAEGRRNGKRIPDAELIGPRGAL
jgi:hypothetical protein